MGGAAGRRRTRGSRPLWSRNAPRPGRVSASPRAARRGTARATAAPLGGSARGARTGARDLAGAPLAVAQHVQAAVGRDAVQPGAQRVALLVSIKSAPGRQQGLLDHVLRVLDRAEDPVAVDVQLAAVGVRQRAERVFVARARDGAGSRSPLDPRTPSRPSTGTQHQRAANSSLSSRRPVFVRQKETPRRRRTRMGKIVMSGPQNMSLDGVVQDPDGAEGFRLGGWFVRVRGQGPRSVEQVRARRRAGRRGMAPGPRELRVLRGRGGDPAAASLRTG